MRNFFNKVFGDKKAFRFTTSNLGEPTGNGTRIRRGNPGSLSTDQFITIDSISQGRSTTYSTSGAVVAIGPNSNPPKEDERKAVQPKEVFAEIKREEADVSFDGLDDKIRVVEERIALLKEHLDEGHLIDEHKALFFLRNRKAYLKTRKKHPFDWALTTTEAIDDLCKRYKLRTVPLKQFYTLVPKDGIREMTRFTAAYKAVTGEQPIFELVVKESVAAPEQRKKDRDPIILANSPFGNHLFIVGAWDDEVEVVDEIIYGMK